MSAITTGKDLLDKEIRRIQRRLAEPFPANEVQFRAGPTNKDKTKAMALAYIDARQVMERLDSVVGIANWQDDYMDQSDGSTLCSLSLRINGEWIVKRDCGAPSDQKESDNRAKSRISEALKRAAVKWGIGRYIYELPPVWCKYDGYQLSERPPIPEWALPSKLPIDGEELQTRLVKKSAQLAKEGKVADGALIEHVRAVGKKAGLPERMAEWDEAGIEIAWEAASEFLKGLKAPAPSVEPQAPEGDAAAQAELIQGWTNWILAGPTAEQIKENLADFQALPQAVKAALSRTKAFGFMKLL